MLEHQKKSTYQWALTLWRRQKEQLVKTGNEIDRARLTHFLKTAVGANCEDYERNRQKETLTSWRRQREGLVTTPKEIYRGELTSWRHQRERLVRTPKEIDRARPTHFLETAEGASCQDMERNRPRQAHSLPGDGRGMGLSGHGKKSTNRWALTLWRRQKEQLVRTLKEIDRAWCTHFLETARSEFSGHGKKSTERDTHFLEPAEGATCHDTERN